MLYGLQLLQGLSLAVLPSSEAIRMPTMDYSSGRTWTRKLNVLVAGPLDILWLGHGATSRGQSLHPDRPGGSAAKSAGATSKDQQDVRAADYDGLDAKLHIG